MTRGGRKTNAVSTGYAFSSRRSVQRIGEGSKTVPPPPAGRDESGVCVRIVLLFLRPKNPFMSVLTHSRRNDQIDPKAPLAAHVE